MNLQYRVEILEKLGNYILSDDAEWLEVKHKASIENGWFIPEFINHACENIARYYLGKNELTQFVKTYSIPNENASPKSVGVIMAGNIPLVGFHDFLCVFLSGHRQTIKASTKDQTLIRHVAEKMIEWNQDTNTLISFAEMLKGCDAYIATGSNNSSRYFEHYFGKYPHIIRRNRTSVALLEGSETEKDLAMLADDVYLYFGLGCRNVTKIYVPEEYDFVPLLEAFRKYDRLADHHKYKNNYDYQLAVLLINKVYYMTNGSLILKEDKALFSPISQLNYEFYKDKDLVVNSLEGNSDIQCVVGKSFIPFGKTQEPSLADFADGTDTLQFLLSL